MCVCVCVCVCVFLFIHRCSNALTTHAGNTRAGVRLLPSIHFILPLQLTSKPLVEAKILSSSMGCVTQ